MPDFDSLRGLNQEITDGSEDTGAEEAEEFVPHRDNPQRVLALNLINTLGFGKALRFARERQWQGVIVQIYRGPKSGPV